MKTIGLAAFVFIVLTGCVNHDINIMPKVLVDYGKNSGCDQIGDYYDDLEELWEPPFAFLWPENIRGAYAAFWCKGSESKTDYRILIYQEVDSSDKLNCPKEIRWDSSTSYPGGISIFYPYTRDLTGFRYIKDKKDSKIKSADGVLIESMHDGTGVYFFCYGDDGWLYKMID